MWSFFDLSRNNYISKKKKKKKKEKTLSRVHNCFKTVPSLRVEFKKGETRVEEFAAGQETSIAKGGFLISAQSN